MRRHSLLCAAILVTGIAGSGAQESASIESLLAKPVISPRQTELDTIEFVDARIPRMRKFAAAPEWEKHAAELRERVLTEVVFRGAAAKWRHAKGKVEWLDTIPGGAGYRIKKLRYEALPGLWIPALLYEPEKLSGKVPVSLAVNGHEGVGKSVKYKQIRCINQAQRGMLVLNVEWLGMGQLRAPGYAHGRMNQLDLCGTSGLAVFYLAMQRGLDVLLDLPNADAERVAVSGLSGGGWQTILLSALDTRVKLCNPVAGYSSFRTRLQHFKDLGDSEQTPCDLATIADYTQLTAMLAPRPALLTYNAKDDCCFESGYALPPLLDAATPVYTLLDKQTALRSHVNHDPGTHNYERENREAFYRLLGDHFFGGDASWRQEIACDAEIKSHEALTVELPAQNADFNSLALGLARNLPHVPPHPADAADVPAWQAALRGRLRDVLRYKEMQFHPTQVGTERHGDVVCTRWKLKLGNAWTLPVAELARGEPKQTAVVCADGGRKAAAKEVEALLSRGFRVFAFDPFYFGECQFSQRAYLFALLVATIGERPLGVQVSQTCAVARWAAGLTNVPVTIVGVGPRTSVVTLAAAALEPRAITASELHQPLTSLKDVLHANRSYEQMPELFCFGLLETCDVPQLAALGKRPK
jgi:hypothetical protein